MQNYYRCMAHVMDFQMSDTGLEGFESRGELHPLLTNLTTSHIFQIDGRIGRLLLLTNNKIRPEILPFPTTFIDMDIEVNGAKFLGVMVWQEQDEHKDDDDWEKRFGEGRKLDREEYEFEGRNDIRINAFYVKKSKLKPAWMAFRLFSGRDTTDSKMNNMQGVSKADYNRAKKIISNLVMNFLDFIHTPDVVLMQHKIPEERNAKRLAKGKTPLPNYTTIKLTGDTKRYVDNLKFDEHNPPSHQFWVHGHYRHLRSKRYKEKRGQRIWIPPYLKGEGILIKKDYKIDNRPVKHKEMWDKNKNLKRRRRRWKKEANKKKK